MMLGWKFFYIIEGNMNSSYIRACDAIYRSIAMDSIKKKTAISGIRKAADLLRRLENLTDRIISIISQDRLRSGTKTNRLRRTLNPESI